MPTGRPREFDPEQALDRAMQVFWRRGYEGATLGELTREMGINRPSLYAAFGSKESLFRKVVDRYVEAPASRVRAALQEPTAHAVVSRLLEESICLATNPQLPPGCLLVQSALACSSEADSLRQELATRRLSGELALRHRLERARQEGDLPAGSDPTGLAKYVTALIFGLAVHAAGGASREELRAAVDVALQAWPTKT